jgi:hypothetical protein
MPFAVAAAGVGVAGSLAAGYMTSQAAGSAASAQEAAANQATQLEQGMYGQAQQNLAPYMDAGTNALSAYQKMLGIGPGGAGPTSPLMQMLGIGPDGKPTGGGIDPSTFQSSPGYRFQMQQGMEAVTNSNAARGGLGGNALKQLQNYGAGQANNSWQQYLQNVNTGWQGLTGQVAGLAGAGQNSATDLSKMGMSLGTEMGSNALAVGNAQSAGIMAQNDAWTGAIKGVSNAAGGYLTGMGGMSGGGGGGQTVSMPGQGSLTYGSNYMAPPPQQYYGGNGMAPTGGYPGYGVSGGL